MPPTDRPATTATTLAETNARVEALWDVLDSLTDLVEKLKGEIEARDAQDQELREQLARSGKSSHTSSKLGDRRVPLTDSLAERALRPYVIWRKAENASQSRRQTCSGRWC